MPSRFDDAYWDPAIHPALDRIIAEARPSDIALFDFDNTIICRDLGDALFETIVRSGRGLNPDLLRATAPDLVEKHAEPPVEALLDRYERLCSATRHQEEYAVAAPGYLWIVQLLAGSTPGDVVRWTHETWQAEATGRRNRLPFVYPAMATLLDALGRSGVTCYIVSATNVWSVRWAVQNSLNPLLVEQFGSAAAIPTDRVFGVNMLLRERATGVHWTDTYLTRNEPGYAALDLDVLDRFEITPFFAPPMTTYGGKVGTIFQFVGSKRALLAAGDSLNDIPLLRFARNGLWIARLERPDLQERAVTLLGEEASRLLIQPTRTGDEPGFVPRSRALRTAESDPEVRRTLAAWNLLPA